MTLAITPTMVNESPAPMQYESSQGKGSHDMDVEPETTPSSYHFTAQTNAGMNVPPTIDPLAAGVVKISAFRQVYSSKKLVWLFWIAMGFWAFAIALSVDTTFVCK